MGDQDKKKRLKLAKSAIYKNIGGGAGTGNAGNVEVHVQSEYNCDNSITNSNQNTSIGPSDNVANSNTNQQSNTNHSAQQQQKPPSKC